MPGRRAGGEAFVKHVGLFPGNPARGLPAHPAAICAFDADTGALRAVLDATALTAARTAGAAALAVDLAARRGARVAAVIGSGPVAAEHLRVPSRRARLRRAARAARATRGRRRAGPRRTARSPRASRRRCGAPTSSASARAPRRPSLLPSWLAPGAHVSSVGFAPPGGELDPGARAEPGR